MSGGAVFSKCRQYRYELWREWIGGEGYCMFICLNPSTADETQDDPTVRRCIAYAKAWGYESLVMTNIFAYRATDPLVMKAAADPVGKDTDAFLRAIASRAGIVVAAWGVHGAHLGRGAAVRAMLPRLHVLKLCADGSPGHPLYLRKDLQPFHWPSPPPQLASVTARPRPAPPGPSRSLPVSSRIDREKY